AALDERARAVESVFAAATPEPLVEAGRIYIVDPHGNLMMSYARDAEPKGPLAELKKRLKFCHIGCCDRAHHRKRRESASAHSIPPRRLRRSMSRLHRHRPWRVGAAERRRTRLPGLARVLRPSHGASRGAQRR